MERRHFFGRHLGIFLGYVLLAVFFTYPVVLRFGSHLAGRGNDLWIFQWNNWWVKHAWSEGLDVYHTSYLFYPNETPLYLHSFSWLNTFLWLLVEPVVGALAAYNVTVLLAYAVSGYTMYLLALDITGSFPAAFLAGIIFSFFPYRYSHRNQLNLLSVQWMPLAVLCFVRLARTGRLRYGLWSGVALALCGLCSWHQLLLLALWGILWIAYHLLLGRWANRMRILAGLVLASVVCLLIVFPFVWPMVTEGGGLLAGSAGNSPSGNQTDLLSYLMPSRYHPLIRRGFLDEPYERLVRFKTVGTLGYTVTGLAVWALVKRKKDSFFWGVVMVCFIALALGTELRINAHAIPGIPMPYRLLALTPLGEIVRHPARFNIVVGMSIAVLAALGIADVLARLLTGRWWLRLLTIVLGVAIFFEFLVFPYPTIAPVESEFYHQLSREPGQFAVVDLPIGFHSHDKWYMYAQTLHNRPMVGGHVSRIPPDAHVFIDSVPLLSKARIGFPEQGAPGDVSRQLDILSGARVRYVLVHKDRAGSDEVERLRTWFVVTPRYEDDYLVAFSTAPRHGRDFEFSELTGDGIGVITTTLSAGVLDQGGTLTADIVWGSNHAPEHDWMAYLALIEPAGRQVQRIVFEPYTDWSTADWGQNAIARTRVSLNVDPFLKSGTYALALGMFEADTGKNAGQLLTIGLIEVKAVPRLFEPPDVQVEYEATFGTALHLLGYGLHRTEDQLTVTLHWKTRQRMDVAYKFFIHLIDVDTGELVAQTDVMPYSWTYPTFWWEAGEFVSDNIPLSLTDVRPGEYQLEIGVYDPDSGLRLPTSFLSEQQSSDRLVLPEVVSVR